MGAAEGRNEITRGMKKSGRIGIAQKEGKEKILNALECGSTRLVQLSTLDLHHACMIT